MNEKQRLSQVEVELSETLRRLDRISEDVQRMRTTQLEHLRFSSATSELAPSTSERVDFLTAEVEKLATKVEELKTEFRDETAANKKWQQTTDAKFDTVLNMLQQILNKNNGTAN